MNLTRLQELTAIQNPALNEENKIQPKAPRDPEHDFEGIKSIVDDALGDLSDKLGKGGSLATLMKDSGASKMDTVKDADGKNVLAQIVAKTSEFKKAIEKLMTEAEILVSQVNEGTSVAGDVLTEANSDYSDSSEFTDEFYGMMESITKIKGKMKNARWMKWMKTTDSNFGTECEVPARSAISAVNTLSAQFDDIDAELDKAS